MFHKRRIFFKIARIIVMLVLVSGLAFIIALTQVNLEQLRGKLLSVMRDTTGLNVQIDGDISWKFSLRPKVVLKNVRIENSGWAKNKNGFYAAEIDLTLNLLSLLRDTPTIQSVKVYKASVFVEQNAHGEYSIAPKLKPKTQDMVPVNNNNKFPFVMDLGIESFGIYDTNINLYGTNYYIQGLYLKHSHGDDNHEYSGWMKLKSVIYPFIASFSEFNEQRKIYPVSIAVSTGGDALVAKMALEGTSLIPIDFTIRGNVQNMADIGSFFGVDLPDVKSVRLDLAGGFGHKKITLRKSSFDFGGSEFNISGTFDWSLKLPKINAKISGGKLNIIEFFPDLYTPGTKWVRPKRDLNVFKDVPLSGELLSTFNGSLILEAAELIVYRDLTLKKVNLNIGLENSKLNLTVNTKIAEGDVRVRVKIDADENGVLNVETAALGERVYTGEIMKELRIDDFISELPMNFEFYFTARGSNLSEIMGSLTGPISLYSVAPGYAYSKVVSYLYGTDFLTDLRHGVQNLFSSKKKGDQITISCLAVNTKVRSGLIESANSVSAETNAINIRMIGKVDFGNETIKASMITVPARGLKISLTGGVANSMEFTGNLAEPDIKLNGAAVAGKLASATGIGLLLAPFTGGIGLIAGAGVGYFAGDLIENWLADDNPCRTTMAKGAAHQKGDPQWLDTPMSALVSEFLK